MNSDYQKKCDDYKNIANWRIKHDNTIEYSYKGIDLPLVCSYRPKYFNQDFYDKLIKKCNNEPENVCIQEDNYCSLNEKNECFFNENRILNKDNKENIYNSAIVNPTKNELKRIIVVRTNSFQETSIKSKDQCLHRETCARGLEIIYLIISV